jgi:dephospho-CoA kinase
MKLLIGIAGKISSGKSTVARYISDTYDIPYVSFGDYLRVYCEKHDLPVDRKTMQDLGQTFVDAGPKEFFEKVIFSKGRVDCIVFDSIRHSAGVAFMKELSEQSVVIYVDTGDATRHERYMKRVKDGDVKKSFEEFIALNDHEVERQIDEVKQYADLVIYPADNYKAVIDQFLSTYISISKKDDL